MNPTMSIPRHSMIVATLLGFGALAGIGILRGELLVYEGFDYEAGVEIHGESGGVGFGDRKWEDNQDHAAERDHVGTGSLTYGSLTTTGNSLRQTSIAVNGSTDNRSINPIPGINGSTTWISFLLRSEGPVSPDQPTHLGVRANPVSEAPFFGVVDNPDGQTVFAISSNTPFTKPDVFTNIAFEAGQTYLIVASIAWDTAPGASELVKLYINPPLGANPPLSPDAFRDDLNIATNGNTNRIASLELASSGDGVAWIFDELRIGEAFSDVVPITVPEPATILAIVGAMAIWGLRKRGRLLVRSILPKA